MLLPRMANIILRPDWHIPEREVTPEDVYRNRRRFLKQLGIAGAGALSTQMIGCSGGSETSAPSGGSSGASGAAVKPSADASAKYDEIAKANGPIRRNQDFDPGWALSNEQKVLTYNNFYEFTTVKDQVHKKVAGFATSPWQVEVSGLVEKPLTLDVADILKQFPIEERVYKFRCVEAWGMIVPWQGFPLRLLLEKAQPKSSAKFVKFYTGGAPKEYPNWSGLVLQGYSLPYTEGLRMDEAMHDLALVGTGLYGRSLKVQNGAPIRLVVPWKYGYKSIKSINKIELVDEQPATLWNTMAPREYPFESNVEPEVPHPRWSQATHKMIDTQRRVRTEYLNGYADQVGGLYKKA